VVLALSNPDKQKLPAVGLAGSQLSVVAGARIERYSQSLVSRTPRLNVPSDGYIQRECIDRVIILGETHLRRIMSRYASYYNQARRHLALGKEAPISRPVQSLGRIITEPMVAGLHHRYARI
jgi:hypothetical protein